MDGGRGSGGKRKRRIRGVSPEVKGKMEEKGGGGEEKGMKVGKERGEKSGGEGGKRRSEKLFLFLFCLYASPQFNSNTSAGDTVWTGRIQRHLRDL